MNTTNHEYYVSLEVSKLLKEAGFDWKCNGVFLSEDGTQYAFIKADAVCDNNNSKYNPYNISAPTLEIAQRWLREVKDIDVYIFPTTNNKRECVYECGIKTYGRTLWIPEQPSTAQYDTYEEAQEAGIKKALEIILEQGE